MPPSPAAPSGSLPCRPQPKDEKTLELLGLLYSNVQGFLVCGVLDVKTSTKTGNAEKTGLGLGYAASPGASRLLVFVELPAVFEFAPLQPKSKKTNISVQAHCQVPWQTKRFLGAAT